MADALALLLRKLVPATGVDPAGLEAAKKELEAVPHGVLIASARALCNGASVAGDIGAILRVLLIDDRLALRPSAMPTALVDEWTASVRRAPDGWPPALLAAYLDWMSWHPNINRRIELAGTLPVALPCAPASGIDALIRLLGDFAPAVRAAAERALASVLSDGDSAIADEIVSRMSCSRIAGQRRAIARALEHGSDTAAP